LTISRQETTNKNDLKLGIAYASVLIARTIKERNVYSRLAMACGEPNMQNYIIPNYKVLRKREGCEQNHPPKNVTYSYNKNGNNV